MYQKDSIVAIATGSGSGGLGVLRISGAKAKDILKKVFLPKHGDNFAFRPRYMHYGSFVITNALQDDLRENIQEEICENTLNISALENILSTHPLENSKFENTHLDNAKLENNKLENNKLENNKLENNTFILDEVLAVYFPAPYSFTGEDVAEIHAHGGSVLLHTMLEHIISLGARHAEAGEFTKRAFLNGRIDLAQAEAVAEIIAAPAIEGVRLAAAKLHGVLGKKIEDLRDQIEYIRRRICLAIDFPEEEGECLPALEFHALVDILNADISRLISAYDRAKPWSEGSLVVLVGQVNAGKSSLMNALLGRQRAIVTAEPGTTRDYLEEPSSLAGIPVRLTDTAGLREIAWVIQNSSQDEYGLSPQILERLSQNLHADMPYFASQDNSFCEKDFHTDIIANLSNDCATTNNNTYGTNANNNTAKKHASSDEKKISPIEVEGIRRSLELMEMADLVFLVFDGTKLLEHLNSVLTDPDSKVTGVDFHSDQEKAKIIAHLMQNELALLPKETKRICIWNKADIAPISVSMLRILEELMNVSIFCISARPKSSTHTKISTHIKSSTHEKSSGESGFHVESKNPQEILQGAVQENVLEPSQEPVQENLEETFSIQNIDDLAKFARSILLKQDSVADEIAPNRRQAGLLQSAKTELDYLKEEIDILPPDLTAIRLESCAQYLSTITGLCSVNDTFNAIFEEFCIGK